MLRYIFLSIGQGCCIRPNVSLYSHSIQVELLKSVPRTAWAGKKKISFDQKSTNSSTGLCHVFRGGNLNPLPDPTQSTNTPSACPPVFCFYCIILNHKKELLKGILFVRVIFGVRVCAWGYFGTQVFT